jgi:glycosyltransferase involved in cell wall biosynthesis
VDHEHDGLLFDPNDIQTITTAIKTLISDNTLREAMGKLAKKKAFQYFHPSQIAKKHIEIYSEIVALS